MSDSWDCVAYGADGTAVGALCFFSPELHERDCDSRQQCEQRMASERRRVFRLANEGAAAGDRSLEVVAEEFGTPDQLLNADRDPDER